MQAGKIPDGADWGRESEGQEGILHVEKEGSSVREVVYTEQGNYMTFYDGIYHALVSGASPPVSAVEAADIIYIIESAMKSHLEKRVIEII